MDEMLSNSGERFVPESNDVELELEHYERYYSARNLVKDKTVLDAACGEGYGSCIIASAACRVYGVDIDGSTIEHAKNKYSNIENLTFFQGSVSDLSFLEDGSVDAVISFETIEHIPEKMQDEFLQEIKRVLRADGILIMSSPNKKEYTDRYGFHNKFHIHELYKSEFEELLNRYFNHTVLYRQYLEVGAFIDREGVDEYSMTFSKNSDKYDPEGKYFIAVASDTEVQTSALSRVTLYPNEQYLRTLDNHNDYVAETQNTIKLKDEELKRRLDELNNRMDLINSLRRKQDELLQEIAGLQNEKDGLQNEKDGLQNEKDGLQNEIDGLKSELGRIREIEKHPIIYGVKTIIRRGDK